MIERNPCNVKRATDDYRCVRDAGHDGEHTFPRTPSEQQEDYRAAKERYDRLMDLWRTNGEQGPRPPRPVPPHTPGWRY